MVLCVILIWILSNDQSFSLTAFFVFASSVYILGFLLSYRLRHVQVKTQVCVVIFLDVVSGMIMDQCLLEEQAEPKPMIPFFFLWEL
jgi:hypothetical protein